MRRGVGVWLRSLKARQIYLRELHTAFFCRRRCVIKCASYFDEQFAECKIVHCMFCILRAICDCISFECRNSTGAVYPTSGWLTQFDSLLTAQAQCGLFRQDCVIGQGAIPRFRGAKQRRLTHQRTETNTRIFLSSQAGRKPHPRRTLSTGLPLPTRCPML